MEKLVIAGREFDSRLFLGTGKFNSNEVMEQSILASGTEMVTVAMKRIELENKDDDMLRRCGTLYIRTYNCYLTPRGYAMPKKLYSLPKWHARLLVPTG